MLKIKYYDTAITYSGHSRLTTSIKRQLNLNKTLRNARQKSPSQVNNKDNGNKKTFSGIIETVRRWGNFRVTLSFLFIVKNMFKYVTCLGS